MNTELEKKYKQIYSTPQCLRSDQVNDQTEFSVLVEDQNVLKAGDTFYYGLTGLFYRVTKILEVRHAKVGPGEVYTVTADIT